MLKRLFERSKKQPKLIIDTTDKVKTAVVRATGPISRVAKSPDEEMEALLAAVQDNRVYADGKTFVDLIPRKRMKALSKEYALASKDPDFDLNEFVGRHFYEFKPNPVQLYEPDIHTTAREHIAKLWPVLTRQNRKTRGSLIALPHQYIVAGGRFSEQYYWDTYFILLGLAADNEWKLVEGIVRNASYMLHKFGMIPTANRSYYLSRSQPPFFAQMIKILARHKGRTRTYAEYLPSLIAEYRFWMKGRNSVNQHTDHLALARVVQMPNGTILNRYFDNKSTPRPEMRRDDVEAAKLSKSHNKDKIFLDFRAAAESGWDFSSRWFSEPSSIQSIYTTDIVPVDLNCLLYQLEITIAEAFQLLKQPLLAKRYMAAAERRKEAILRYCWNPQSQFFEDYDFRKGHTTGQLTLAGVFPLFAKIATSEQAATVAYTIKHEFLKKGGLVTTLENNGQQWDSPNGWAPLQYIAIMGLREYGYHGLANEIRDRWLTVNDAVFAEKRKMVEKYDVVNAGGGGGGEYPLQDGFGWTNGVYAALYDERERERG